MRPSGLIPERETLPSTAGCVTQPPAALLIAMLWLTACKMGASETRAPCSPFIDWASAEKARANPDSQVRSVSR